MNYIRPFVSGLALPATFLPLAILILWATGKTDVILMPSIHFIPIIWGLWNVIYFALFRNLFPINLDLRLFLTGAILGFLIALYGVFYLQLPTIIGFPENVYYIPLIALPIVYAILWRFIVKPLNDLVEMRE